MSFIVTIVHVFVCFFLMLTVLLQAGKGGGMGATFGGGSSQGSVFGGSGAGNFLSRLTTVSAVVFMLTSMTLAFLASTSGEDSLKKYSAQQRATAADKKRLDKEATDLNTDTQPDEGAVDESGDNVDSEEPALEEGSEEAKPTDNVEAAEEPAAQPTISAPPAETAPEATKKNTEATSDEPPAVKPVPSMAPAPALPKAIPATKPKPASFEKPATPKPLPKAKGDSVPKAEPAPAAGE